MVNDVVEWIFTNLLPFRQICFYSIPSANWNIPITFEEKIRYLTKLKEHGEFTIMQRVVVCKKPQSAAADETLGLIAPISECIYCGCS